MSTERRINLRVALVAGAVGLSAGAATFVSAVVMSEGDPAQRGNPAAYVDDLSGTVRGLAPDAAIRDVVVGTGLTHVADAHYQAAKGTEKAWLEIHVLPTGEQDDPDNMRAQWEAALAYGAIAELMRTSESQDSNRDVLDHLRVILDSSSDGAVELSSGAGSVALGQVFGSQSSRPSDEEMAQRADLVLADFGLAPVDVQVLRPLGAAMAIVAEVPVGPKPSWTIDELRDALNGDPRSYEGLYIMLVDPSGAPLLRAGAAYRSGSGSLWFAPGQDTRFGAIHGGGPES